MPSASEGEFYLSLRPFSHSFIRSLLSIESLRLCHFKDASSTTHYPRSEKGIQASVLSGVSAWNSGRTSTYVATKTTGFARVSSSLSLKINLTSVAATPTITPRLLLSGLTGVGFYRAVHLCMTIP